MHFLYVKNFLLAHKKSVLLMLLFILCLCLFISLGSSDVPKEVTPAWMLPENFGSFKNVGLDPEFWLQESPEPEYPYLYGKGFSTLEDDLKIFGIEYSTLEADPKIFGIETEE
jgi:hypothetical protein